MVFIIDEWLWHDLSNENGENRQKEAFIFLKKVYEKCDKIIIVKDSKFAQKMYHFSKLGDSNFEARKKHKFFLYKFLYNSQKIFNLEFENLISETQRARDVLKNVNEDDHYLVLTHFHAGEQESECVIITTDQKLMEVLTNAEVICRERDKFLKSY